MRLSAVLYRMDRIEYQPYKSPPSIFLHRWYIILLTPNIRHVSKCSSPNWPLITFAEHTYVWGVCWTYLSWGCHVCSGLFSLIRLQSHKCIVLSIYVFCEPIFPFVGLALLSSCNGVFPQHVIKTLTHYLVKKIRKVKNVTVQMMKLRKQT